MSAILVCKGDLLFYIQLLVLGEYLICYHSVWWKYFNIPHICLKDFQHWFFAHQNINIQGSVNAQWRVHIDYEITLFVNVDLHHEANITALTNLQAPMHSVLRNILCHSIFSRGLSVYRASLGKCYYYQQCTINRYHSWLKCWSYL